MNSTNESDWHIDWPLAKEFPVTAKLVQSICADPKAFFLLIIGNSDIVVGLCRDAWEKHKDLVLKTISLDGKSSEEIAEAFFRAGYGICLMNAAESECQIKGE